ncbi:MAG: hypothetical protein ABIT01_01205 [Thermoanaerobaculia bacterium]
MALTQFQRAVCRLIAENRVAQGESYVAGGVALNLALHASRISRDIDLFHDTQEALAASWDADRRLLLANGYDVAVATERPAYVEAVVTKDEGSVLVQWVRDSAYRFFPLVRDDELGLTLHPLDLATNKTLALVGRLEVRDWVDLIGCHERIQQLGYLAWAACGKDPGFSPRSILEHARRSSHYSAPEVQELSFDDPPPDAGELSRAWRAMLREADEIVSLLPVEEAGKCVISGSGALFAGAPAEARVAVAASEIHFHAGTIRGVLPTIRG